MKRLLATLTLVTLASALTGCGADREMTARVLTLEEHTKTQFRLLQQQNEFLNRKVNTLNEKITAASELSEELREELATYADRPYEVKLEILQDLNTRFASIVNELEDYKSELNEEVDADITAVNDRVDTYFADMDELLTYHTNFVEFAMTEQDSINRVFANRLDSRPWYESIIGKWEDKQRAQDATP